MSTDLCFTLRKATCDDVFGFHGWPEPSLTCKHAQIGKRLNKDLYFFDRDAHIQCAKPLNKYRHWKILKNIQNKTGFFPICCGQLTGCTRILETLCECLTEEKLKMGTSDYHKANLMRGLGECLCCGYCFSLIDGCYTEDESEYSLLQQSTSIELTKKIPTQPTMTRETVQNNLSKYEKKE